MNVHAVELIIHTFQSQSRQFGIWLNKQAITVFPCVTAFNHRTKTIGVKVSFDGTATIHQANICRVAVVTKLCSSINEDTVVILAAQVSVEAVTFSVTFALHGSHVTFRRRHRHTGQPATIFSHEAGITTQHYTIYIQIIGCISRGGMFLFTAKVLNPYATLVIFAQTDSILTGGERVSLQISDVSRSSCHCLNHGAGVGCFMRVFYEIKVTISSLCQVILIQTTFRCACGF
ncbi:hypothetical protein HmCmsJML097_01274 [Escherichia coli]|nr:hypothetical protein HmCmsJML097_01274 [Escherichia coli]